MSSRPEIRVLGIDPGSLITGYGVITVQGNKNHFVDCGFIETSSKDPLAVRLKTIYEGIAVLIQQFQPDQVAIEQVFVHRNVGSALKLGQARGAAICAAAVANLPVSEYSPRTIKQAVVGRGSADKSQVQHMIKALLSLPEPPLTDSADALAVALCHGHMSQTMQQIQQGVLQGGSGGRRKSGRWRL